MRMAGLGFQVYLTQSRLNFEDSALRSLPLVLGMVEVFVLRSPPLILGMAGKLQNLHALSSFQHFSNNKIFFPKR
jgi:hypothetical protein